MKLKTKIKFRVEIFPESKSDYGPARWNVVCKRLNLVGVGRTKPAARKSFERVLLGHIALANSEGRDPFGRQTKQTFFRQPNLRYSIAWNP